MSLVLIRASVMAAVLAAGASAALAQAGAGHGCEGWDQIRARKEARVNEMLDRINATPEQRARIQEIARQLFDQGRMLHEQTVETHDAVAEEWQKDTPDQARINQLVDQQLNAVRQFAQQKSAALFQVHGILTPEQRSTLVEEHRKDVQCP